MKLIKIFPYFFRDDDIIHNMKRKYYSREYKNMLQSRQNLPAWNSVDDILDLLRNNQVIVVVGETGCGKSTQVRKSENFCNTLLHLIFLINKITYVVCTVFISSQIY